MFFPGKLGAANTRFALAGTSAWRAPFREIRSSVCRPDGTQAELEYHEMSRIPAGFGRPANRETGLLVHVRSRAALARRSFARHRTTVVTDQRLPRFTPAPSGVAGRSREGGRNIGDPSSIASGSEAAFRRSTVFGVESLAAIHKGAGGEKCNSSGQRGWFTPDPFLATCYARNACLCRSGLYPLVLHSSVSRFFFPPLCDVSMTQ